MRVAIKVAVDGVEVRDGSKTFTALDEEVKAKREAEKKAKQEANKKDQDNA